MTNPDVVLARLRSATGPERAAIARALDVEVDADPDVCVVHLADKYREAAVEKDYRKILIAVAGAVAKKAEWKLDSIPDVYEFEWIEEYIYRALGFLAQPNRTEMSDFEKAKVREQAELALRGQLPPPKEQSDNALTGVLEVAGAAAFVIAFGWVAVAGIAGAGLLGWLFGTNMKKVEPATLLLIHVRKRQEFEEVLSKPSEAA